LNICALKPHHRKAAKRYVQPYEPLPSDKTSDFLVVKKLGVNGLLKVNRQSQISPLNKILNRSLNDKFQQVITSPCGLSLRKAGNG